MTPKALQIVFFSPISRQQLCCQDEHLCLNTNQRPARRFHSQRIKSLKFRYALIIFDVGRVIERDVA